MRLIILAATMLVSGTALAEATVSYPVRVPQECVELAQRESVPVVIRNEVEGMRAMVRLTNMRNSDHLVRECRAAIARAQQAFNN
jgi:hypothetical protein